MRKIPTIFERDFEGDPSRVLPVQNPECAWVFDGEGTATRKYDGTCCMFDGADWWKRREVKKGKTAPPDFREEMHDQNTGKRVGWVPVTDDDKWHLEGIRNTPLQEPETYELCGPKVQGNPEGFDRHVMVAHSLAETYPDCPRDFDGLSVWLSDLPHEGVVFHHPDGRMAKIKRRDFGHK